MKGIFLVVILMSAVISSPVYSQDNVEREIDNYMDSYLFQKALNVIDSHEETIILKHKKAVCLKNLNRYADAATIWESIINDYPDDKQSAIELSACYQALSKWDKAIACYDQLIEKDSSNVYFRIQRADIYLIREKYEAALAEYKSLVEVYNMDNMLRRVALCYDKINMPDSAKVYYSKAWSKDFFDTSSVAGLVNLNIKAGKLGFDEAIRISDTYVNKDSTNQQINLLNALSYYAADLYEDAVIRFNRCYNNGDTSLVVIRSMALSYYSLGQNDYAYDFLQKAYKMDSTNINVLYALGVVANEKMYYDTGKKCFTMLIDKVVPSDFTLYQYYRNMAIAYEGKNEFKESVESYKMAVKYANDKQKMHLYYTIVSIYDVDLKLPKESLDYYILYRGSLQAYSDDLLKIVNPDKSDNGEISVTGQKIAALDKQIARLRKTLGLVDDKAKITSTIQINL